MRIINRSGRTVPINLDPLRSGFNTEYLAQIRKLNPHLQIERTAADHIGVSGNPKKERDQEAEQFVNVSNK